MNRRKKEVSIVGLAVIILTMGSVSLARYSGGTGEPNSPYRIATPNDLNDIGNHVEDYNKCFVLVNDIDMLAYTGTMYNIIGDLTNPFTGVFDGNDRTISNFRYSSSHKDNIGLFGYVFDANAQIKDLGLINPNVTVGEQSIYVGSLIGLLDNGTLINCYTYDGIIKCNRMTAGDIGGLVGKNRGLITNCYSMTHVEGLENGSLGGLVGSNDGTIISSYSLWSPSGYISVGGLVGNNFGFISNCFATGGAWGYWEIGGLVGDNSGTVSYCYATGNTAGSGVVGGLSGHNTGTLLNCFTGARVSSDELWLEGGLGGLVGWNTGIVIRCYAQGRVDGTTLYGGGYVGGLIGSNYGSINRCYSRGRVTGNETVGGLIGLNSNCCGGGSVAYSFWDAATSGQSSMCGIADGNGCDDDFGKTTVQMQMTSTFTDAGWDFVGEEVNGTENIWRLCNESAEYPKLNCQMPEGDLLCPDGVSGEDFAYFAARWADDNCADSNDCEGADSDLSGEVDGGDLKILCEHWLE